MEYFANDNYIEDINEENPLGMKGEIARAFGEMVKNMWSGRYTYVVPRNFKMAVGRYVILWKKKLTILIRKRGVLINFLFFFIDLHRSFLVTNNKIHKNF